MPGVPGFTARPSHLGSRRGGGAPAQQKLCKGEVWFERELVLKTDLSQEESAVTRGLQGWRKLHLPNPSRSGFPQSELKRRDYRMLGDGPALKPAVSTGPCGPVRPGHHCAGATSPHPCEGVLSLGDVNRVPAGPPPDYPPSWSPREQPSWSQLPGQPKLTPPRCTPTPPGASRSRPASELTQMAPPPPSPGRPTPHTQILSLRVRVRLGRGKPWAAQGPVAGPVLGTKGSSPLSANRTL